jgi:esterase/lipase superfamily enzyme
MESEEIARKSDELKGLSREGAVRAARDLTADYLDRSPKKEIYLYVHGYNNNFEDAAAVIAQLWHFLGREGLPVFYTWPAGFGGARGYFRDRESGEFTIFHLKTYLRTLAGTRGLEKLHILAHSRGTDVILTALRELHLENGSDPEKTRKALKLGNLILAAPDLDTEVLGMRVAAEMVHRVPERLTIYISPDDAAIGLAGWLFGSIRRLGRLTINLVSEKEEKGLIEEPTLELIEADIKAGMIGHSYFYSNPAVSSDVILVLRDNLDPGAENGRPLIERGPSMWQITDDYPVFRKSRMIMPGTNNN